MKAAPGSSMAIKPGVERFLASTDIEGMDGRVSFYLRNIRIVYAKQDLINQKNKHKREPSCR
jgi:hypothetical protein